MWIKQNNELSYSASEIQALNEIPVGNWFLKYSMTRGFYLEETPKFKFPKKIYGDSEHIAARYINTFAKQSTNLGVLLTGLKGTGKSVTAKLTCHQSNLPVILITEPFTGDGFKSFLSNITQEVVVFIDEFEKVYYDESLQNSFLSILDGIFEGKKLFLFTSNQKSKINPYMINRPGRVHYLREYEALDFSIISDVIDDNLVIKENKAGLLEVLNILGNVTMDMLISLIKEMNLYSETARESIRYLNLKPEQTTYSVAVFQNNLFLGTGGYDTHPLTQEIASIEIYAQDLMDYAGGATNHNDIVTKINRAIEKHDESLQPASPEGESDSKWVGEAKEVSSPGPSDSKKAITQVKTSVTGFKPDIGGYLRFDINTKNCTVEYREKEVIITDEANNLRYVFKKRTYFVFNF